MGVIAGWIAIAGFTLMLMFQLALAAGAPLAHYSWGGRFEGVLPAGFRIASLFSAAVFAVGILAVLELLGIVEVFGDAAAGVILWVMAGMSVLSTLGNLASKSPSERKVMAPVAAVLAVASVVAVVWLR